MSSHDLFDEIKAAIHQSRDEHKDLAEDVVRILKFKRGLLLADPKNATETFADQGLGYQDARDSMDKILSSFSDTTSDACIQIKQAVNEYFDAEPEEKLEKLDNNKPGVCELSPVRLQAHNTNSNRIRVQPSQPT